MNGRGWQCDYCDTREITEMPPLYNYHHIHDAPPVGWFTIIGPSTGPMNSENGYLAVDRKEFCSWNCVENYAYVQVHSKEPKIVVDQTNDPTFDEVLSRLTTHKHVSDLLSKAEDSNFDGQMFLNPSNIVTRLEQEHWCDADNCNLAQLAADEIERLRADRDRWRALAEYLCQNAPSVVVPDEIACQFPSPLAVRGD